jgi:hypothetical protein
MVSVIDRERSEMTYDIPAPKERPEPGYTIISNMICTGR